MSGEAQGLRILLVIRHTQYADVYESLVRELAERGHAVHVGYIGAHSTGTRTLDRLAVHPSITHGKVPTRGRLDGWASVAWLARALGDLGRFSHPRFASSPALRNRMANKVQAYIRGAPGFDPLTRRLGERRARQMHARTDAALAERAIRVSAWLEKGIPVSRRATSFIRTQSPDVVLASPLVDLASPVLEYLKAARRLGIRTGICVASWDNLTSKGLLRFVPERVFVWNETQRKEAVELHGAPEDRVVATGAARFDSWFTRRPSTSPLEFLDKVGLDAERPYLLYLCSSRFIAPDEIGAVIRWLEALRGAQDKRLRSAGVLIRPYPKRVTEWQEVNLSRFGNVTLWPPVGRAFGRAEAEADFYDSIAHCSAVVGVNTSAMIEAAIVGKSVLTWLAPEFAQEGTIHFHYLLHERGGFLHVAESLDEHLTQLAETLAGGAAEADQTRRFVEAFVRPAGPHRPATAIYADAVEELARLQPATSRRSWTGLGLRLGLTPVAFVSSLALGARVAKSAVRSLLPGEARTEPREPRVGPARA
jgi:hypothetical protein